MGGFLGLSDSYTSQLIARSLDAHLVRQQAITSNIANVETAGYNRRDVAFEDVLQGKLSKDRSGKQNGGALSGADIGGISMRTEAGAHFINENQTAASAANDSPDWQVIQDTKNVSRNDNNGVDVETEMVKMAQNASRFKALASMQGRLNQQLKQVINSGG